MYKVYLDLKKKIPAVFGNFLYCDETYMYLQDGPVVRMVPLNKIAHIEDLTDTTYRPQEKIEKPSPPATQSLTSERSDAILGMSKHAETATLPAPPPTITDMAELRNRLKAKRDAIPAAQEPIDTHTMVVNVVVSGAEDKSILVEVPSSSFVPNQYSPTLAKELAKNLEMKSILENGIIFDGAPQVIGTNVYIKTKRMMDTVVSAVDKMGSLSKINNIVSGFSKPAKTYITDFAVNDAKVAIPHSPFDGPLQIHEADDADSSDQSSAGEGQDSGEVSEGDG